jgi:hypothetical protein
LPPRTRPGVEPYLKLAELGTHPAQSQFDLEPHQVPGIEHGLPIQYDTSGVPVNLAWDHFVESPVLGRNVDRARDHTIDIGTDLNEHRSPPLV